MEQHWSAHLSCMQSDSERSGVGERERERESERKEVKEI